MKIPRLPLILTITVLFGLLLSACSGASVVNTWPGISAGDGVVYLAYQTGVFAVDVNTGSTLWRYPAKADGGRMFFAAPAPSDGQLLAGDYSATLHSLNPGTGEQKWEFKKESGHFVASPLEANGVVLAPSSDYNLYALDANGAVKWTFKTSNVLWAQPASDDTLVYLPAMDHSLYALKLSDGSKVWSAKLGGSMLGAPVLQDGVLYVTTIAGQVYAVNAADGSELWNVETGEQIFSSPVFYEGSLYVGTIDGNVYAILTEANLDAASRVLWKVSLDGSITGGGALIPSGVVFTTETGVVQALSYDGKTLWSQKVNGKLYSTPVVVNDTLVVAATEGDALMTAFNLDGGQKWIYTVPK